MTLSGEIRDREFGKFRERGGAVTLSTGEAECTQAMENNANGQPVYVGRAAPGTAQDAAGWQIQKFTYSGNAIVKIEWADGNAEFDKKWTLRATAYTYS